MKEKLAKLIDVKSIVTFMLAILFFVLAINGIITGEQVNMIFTTVIAFYFGTQSAKKTEGQQVANGKAECLQQVNGRD